MIDHGILLCGFHGLRQKATGIFRSVFRVPFVLFLQRFRNKAGTVVKQSASQPAQKAGHLIKITLIQSGHQPSPVVGLSLIHIFPNDVRQGAKDRRGAPDGFYYGLDLLCYWPIHGGNSHCFCGELHPGGALPDL